MPDTSLLTPSRRSFLRLAGATAAALPIMTESHMAWAAIGHRSPQVLPGSSANPVMINANENPLGPCAGAIAACDAATRTGGRYDANGASDRLVALLSKQYNLPADHIAVYAGSSEPLHFSVLAFTSATRPYVTADPSYEAGMWAASVSGAPIFKVRLTPDYSHDVKAMVEINPNAGLLYICNPNNPTGTLTSKKDILWANEHKPKGSILLVDEAYIHLSTAPSVIELVDQGADVVVLRTFSKIYGMAGIRCGVALARPDLLKRLQKYGMNPLPVTAVAAAAASLEDPTLVETRRKIIGDTRTSTFAWLDSKGYKYVPSVSNCFMIDTGRPGKDVIAAMQKRNVFIGRTWPIWPNHVRVSVGTPEEMAAFQTAFETVMSEPVPPVKS